MKLIQIDDKFFNPYYIVSIKPEYREDEDEIEQYRIKFVDGSFYFIDKDCLPSLLKAFDLQGGDLIE